FATAWVASDHVAEWIALQTMLSEFGGFADAVPLRGGNRSLPAQVSDWRLRIRNSEKRTYRAVVFTFDHACESFHLRRSGRSPRGRKNKECCSDCKKADDRSVHRCLLSSIT